MRLEGEHGVAAADHLAVAEVDAVEGADGHAARAGLGVLEVGDFHLGNTTVGLSVSVRRSAIAIRWPPCTNRRWVSGFEYRVSSATPFAAFTASSSSSSYSGMKSRASFRGRMLSSLASSRRNGPIAVLSSSSQ